MICKLYLICIFAMFSMISSEHFCQKFRNNNDKIGFTFRRDFSISKGEIGYTETQIMIDGQCWPIKFKHEMRGKSHSLTINASESKKCPLFSNDYKFGICLNQDKFQEYKKRGTCDAFLFNNNTNKGIIGQIPNDDHNSYKPLTDYKLKTNLTITGLKGTSFVSVYQSDKSESKGKLVFIVLEGRKLKGRLYDWDLSGNTFKFIENDKTPVSGSYPLLSGEHTVGNEDVLAIISQYSEQYELRHKGKGWGFIFLFNNNLDISWCWTPDFKYECKSESLINCGSYKKVPKSTESTDSPVVPTEEDESKSFWLYPIIITVAIIIVILIVGIAVFVMKNKRSDQPEATSVSSSAAPKPSINESKGFSSAFSLGKSGVKNKKKRSSASKTTSSAKK